MLAEKENCADEDAGINHKSLAAAARSEVKSLKHQLMQLNQAHAELLVKLEDANVRAKQARDARHSVKAPVLSDKNLRMSAESIATAEATLSGMRSQATLIGKRTASQILNTEIIVTPHEHA